ncbi:uncharacterized protein LOC110841569 isoform X2 [Zootermopsis nevadensis]|nr:uncharacterized protein LOC110841569 isoform X2 [Zootermopsis nevadensis]
MQIKEIKQVNAPYKSQYGQKSKKTAAPVPKANIARKPVKDITELKRLDALFRKKNTYFYSEKVTYLKEQANFMKLYNSLVDLHKRVLNLTGIDLGPVEEVKVINCNTKSTPITYRQSQPNYRDQDKEEYESDLIEGLNSDELENTSLSQELQPFAAELDDGQDEGSKNKYYKVSKKVRQSSNISERRLSRPKHEITHLQPQIKVTEGRPTTKKYSSPHKAKDQIKIYRDAKEEWRMIRDTRTSWVPDIMEESSGVATVDCQRKLDFDIQKPKGEQVSSRSQNALHNRQDRGNRDLDDIRGILKEVLAQLTELRQEGRDRAENLYNVVKLVQTQVAEVQQQVVDLQASLISNYRPKKEMEFTRTRENRQEMKNRAFQIVARNLLEEQQRERDKITKATLKVKESKTTVDGKKSYLSKMNIKNLFKSNTTNARRR